MVTILIQSKFKVIPKKHDLDFFSKTRSISKPSNQKYAKSALAGFGDLVGVDIASVSKKMAVKYVGGGWF